MNEKHKTREAWLLAAIERARLHFRPKGYEIPPIRVSCGWPHTGGTAKRKRVVGECWPHEADAEGIVQIFISPYLAEPASADGVLSVLVHELVHAAVGCKEKHGKAFKTCALAVGLTGKMTATVAGEGLLAILGAWSAELGAYPHAVLDLSKTAAPKQGTRMIKCECQSCGYVIRTTKKWLLESGAPYCPCNFEPLAISTLDLLGEYAE